MGVFPVVAIVAVIAGIALVLRSARSFEQNKIARGEWDENGPLDPSDPPPNYYPRQLTGLRTIEVLNEMSTDDGEAGVESEDEAATGESTNVEAPDSGATDAGPSDSPPPDSK